MATHDARAAALSALLILCLAPVPRPAHALGVTPDTAWTSVGRLVAGAANAQSSAVIAPATGGGVFVAWEDARVHPDTSVVFAQRLLADGTVAAGWPAAGVACATGPGARLMPQVVGDGSAGVYVVWEDYRAGPTPQLYAQRLSSLGVPLPGWPASGVRVCHRSGAQRAARVAADDAGGLLVVWEDYRVPQPRIAAQHLLGDGSFAPGWPDTGRFVAPAAGGQVAPAAVADGAGGVFACWSDGRGGPVTSIDVYAQRLRGDGQSATGWPEAGLPVCTATGAQDRARVALDGLGGALFAWSDPRNGQFNIYAQRLTGAGVVAGGWPLDGVTVSNAAPGQFDPVITSDGHGRAYIAWIDSRGGVGNSDLYAQRLEGDGTPLWMEDGIPICTAPGDQLFVRMVADGFGGILLAWQDGRFAPEARLFAQRLNELGEPVTGWPADGLLVADTNRVEEPPVLAAAGDGGAYLAWSGTLLPAGPSAPDVFAARVRGNAVVPALASLVSARAETERVVLRWWTRGSAAVVDVERREEDTGWRRVAVAPVGGGGLVDWVDLGVAPGRRYGYRLSSPEGAAGEAWVTVPRRGLALALRGPQPASDRAVFAVALGTPGAARLEVFDVAGRRRWTRDFGGAEPAGEFTIDTSALEPGVYGVRLSQGGLAASARLLVAR